MRRAGCIGVGLVLALAVASGAAAQEKPARLWVNVRADHKDHLYKLGETAVLTVDVWSQGKRVTEGQATWRLSVDGCTPAREGSFELANPESVSGTLSEPGFLLLEVTVKTPDGRERKNCGGAAFELEKVKPSRPMPEDFASYWAKERGKLSALPMQPTLTAVEPDREGVELFDVQIDCPGGKPVSAYFARPLQRQGKKLPAILFVHGAGVRSSNKGSPQSWASRGALAMDINAHGLPNGKPKEFYKKAGKAKISGYTHLPGKTRESSYFHGMFLRMIRALDFLCAQPEWDGEHLVVTGGSQGGAQSIAAAGLDSRVSAIAAHEPAMCDRTGVLIGRPSGWPRPVRRKDGTYNPDFAARARYFDSMNFGQCATARGLFSVGFRDRACPPTTVYAMYNVYAGPKEIVNLVNAGHHGSDIWRKRQRPFLFATLGLKEEPR